MNLKKKKELAARTLGVGKERIIFNINRLEEIKEAITKQDINQLYKDKAIFVIEIKGTKKKKKRKTRRRAGSRKKRLKNKKREYINVTRKLRRYVSYLKKKGFISKEQTNEIRKKIRARVYKNLSQLKARLSGIVTREVKNEDSKKKKTWMENWL